MRNSLVRVYEYPSMEAKSRILRLLPLLMPLPLLVGCGQQGPLYLEDWEAKADRLEVQLDEERRRNDVLREELRRYRLMLGDQLEPPAETLEGDRPAKPAPLR